MNELDQEIVWNLARLFHDYSIAPDRAEKISIEINGYLRTIERLRDELEFDDAPADFERLLLSEALI